MAQWLNLVSRSAGPAAGIFNKVYFYFLIIIFLTSFSKSALMSYQSGSMSEVNDFFQEKLLFPTLSMGEEAKIIANEGFYPTMTGVWWEDLYENLVRYATIIFNLLIIFLYIRILTWLVLKMVLWDDSKVSVAWSIGILAFFGIQMILASELQGVSVWDPVKSFYHLFRAIMQIEAPGWVDKVPIG